METEAGQKSHCCRGSSVKPPLTFGESVASRRHHGKNELTKPVKAYRNVMVHKRTERPREWEKNKKKRGGGEEEKKGAGRSWGRWRGGEKSEAVQTEPDAGVWRLV